ncbi:MAG TPA: hypothetical protein VLF93_00665 [Candidatus Saccharimonadales bacterium]|nr:hypothetical protein [Candidatus Saccharimonadales bacterium]
MLNSRIQQKAYAANSNIYFNGQVNASVYSANYTSTTFTATPQNSVLFTQSFPNIAFNGFSPEVPCSNLANTDSGDRPMIDRIPLSNGSCNIVTLQANGYQAGLGSLVAFDVVFTGTFYVDAPGKIPISVNHDDGWFLGIGSANGQQPTNAGGNMTNTPAKTPFKGYQVVAGYNDDKNGAPNNTQVNFPAAGMYPFELDYFEVNQGTLYLILNANNKLIQQAPPPTPTPTQTPTPKPTPTPTPAVYTISGNVFLDSNKNDILDSNESNYVTKPIVSANKGTTTDNVNGSYTISNVPAGTLNVNYTSLPSGYYMTTPLNGPPPSYNITVGPSCNTSGIAGAICTNGNITNLNFGITNTHPWYQSNCGNIRDDNGIVDSLPAGQVALSISSACKSPGLLYTGAINADLGLGQASVTNQIVGGTKYPEMYPVGTQLPTSYNVLLSKARDANIKQTNLSTVCNITNCTLPPTLNHGIYIANGNVSLNAFKFPANQNYVFLINGNLTINGPISVPIGSTMLFSSKGNITVASTVGAATPTSTTSNLDGWYIAGQSFILPTAGNCTDLRLNIAGSVVVNALGTGGTLQNSRDLCGNDTTYPTISFLQRLDMILNAPEFLGEQKILTREANP